MQKGYSKYFSRIQWSPETSVCFNLVLHLRKKKNRTLSDFSIISRDRQRLFNFKYRRYQKKLLRRVTTSLSLRNYLPPTRKVCKKVTANISPGYNGAQKPLFVLISFCTYEKKKPNTFRFFYYIKRQRETF
jgi:hypothetical protein